ncbi:MAG TPA: cobalamin-dependent protein [Bacteroidota bacterium]|nr:cobalamin-dependent protein [Bacteroidota bacterium]
MGQSTLSTQELAAMFTVTETTIKRWADCGKIPCTKTLGGHRKFLMRDVIAFAEHHHYEIPGVLPANGSRREQEQIEIAILTKNYARLSERLRMKAMHGDSAGVFDLLLCCSRHHLPLFRITDEIIRPAMARIGELWMSNEIEINQEHRASHAVMEGIIRLAPELHRKTANGRTAICACPEGEYHEIGLRCLAVSLESEGWNVEYLGANTPFTTLASFLRPSKADLVCLSATFDDLQDGRAGQFRDFGAVCRSFGVTLTCGGLFLRKYPKEELGCDFIGETLTGILQFVRDRFGLRPGPKKNSEAGVPANNH